MRLTSIFIAAAVLSGCASEAPTNVPATKSPFSYQIAAPASCGWNTVRQGASECDLQTIEGTRSIVLTVKTLDSDSVFAGFPADSPKEPDFFLRLVSNVEAVNLDGFQRYITELGYKVETAEFAYDPKISSSSKAEACVRFFVRGAREGRIGEMRGIRCLFYEESLRIIDEVLIENMVFSSSHTPIPLSLQNKQNAVSSSLRQIRVREEQT